MGKGDEWGPYGGGKGDAWGCKGGDAWGKMGMYGGGYDAWGMKGGGKGGKAPKPKTPQVEWVAKPANAMPDVVMLQLPADCKLIATGICQNPIPVIEHEKLDIFSEAHHILQNLCGDEDLRTYINLEHASVDDDYPEILQAWKAAGREENIPSLAKFETGGCCAIGMGGKKNAERAVKLALSLVIAQLLDPSKVAEVCSNYPVFKQFLTHAGVEIMGVV